MSTKCAEMMQNMIMEIINNLEKNGALKIPVEEAYVLFSERYQQSKDHYRRNKQTKTNRRLCPHPGCGYGTYYSKNNIRAHFLAKHTPENELPFQCTRCVKGFAQKAAMKLHMERYHNIC